MKLFRYGKKNEERPAILLNSGRRIDISALTEDFTPQFFEQHSQAEIANWISKNADSCPEVPVDVRYGSALSRPGKIVCIGLNYKEHAEETGARTPDEPIVFMKAPSALNGPNDSVVIPRGSSKTDYEIELAVVIGRRASYVTKAEAEDHIFGYSLMVDYSERDFQKERKGQWTKGKSCDTFAPLGPYVCTRDELVNPQNLDVWLRVNGDLRQSNNTSRMIFSIHYIVSYLSQFMSLMPGDIISTGTPSGVGLGMNPPEFLKAGDKVSCGIGEIGEATQEIVRA
jgi:2-keto-4-pentenoate hydratase/2-oxohepta-3-ene-1,7-dioic acid hydratase in catechol pathway